MAARFVLWLALVLAVSAAHAQLRVPQDRLTVLDLALGTHVSEMPAWEEFKRYACGSNGGPPLLFIAGWEEFHRCATDEATGLSEVYFEYDDELEYVARANDLPFAITRWAGTQLFGHPIMVSGLFSDAGVLAGVRILTDSRADYVARDLRVELEDREAAHELSARMMSWYGIVRDEHCIDLPPAEGEAPVGRRFIKRACERLDAENNRRVVVEMHFFRKAGQRARDPFLGRLTEGQFESSTRLEIFLLDPSAAAPID